MSDQSLETLALAAGISIDWIDAFHTRQRVSAQTLRGILAALGHEARSEAQVREGLARLAAAPEMPAFVTCYAGEPFAVPGASEGDGEIVLEGGAAGALRSGDAPGTFIAPHEIGYHRARIGGHALTVAVAPRRCFGVAQALDGQRCFGSAAQIYSLRGAGDFCFGIGDFGCVADAAEALAARGADALAVSPTHAPFLTSLDQPSPYSPSSRLALNPLLADASAVLGTAAVRRALAEAGLSARAAELDNLDLVDWPGAGALKLTIMRQLFEQLPSHAAQADFEVYRAQVGRGVQDHALFEVLQADCLASSPAGWDWRGWPAGLRDSAGPQCRAFADRHARQITFHIFLQWLAERSLKDAQMRAISAGMRIGIISDLAVGTDPCGSHPWSRPADFLAGLTIGAPPDLLSREGQGWGLATLSPQALKTTGYAPFIETLRATMRHTGGIRIDHVMGLARLWVVPAGASASEGAYLAFPFEDMLRLILLESHRQRAVVIGEDLGTVPPGLRERLDAAGIHGMRVLPFEREADGLIRRASSWARDALAMTSTHDTPTAAGWWKERDIDWRAHLGLYRDDDAQMQDRRERAEDRRCAWSAYLDAGVLDGPQPADDDGEAAADGAVLYVAATPCCLAIVPLEDILALDEAPNLPGTVDRHPNWRRRIAGPVQEQLAKPRPAKRLADLQARKGRP